MLKRLTIATVFGFLLTACAGGPPPEPPGPPPLDLVGTYDFVFAAEGMEMGGSMVIGGSAEEGYTGSIESEMGSASMTDITVDGQTVTFFVPEADGEISIVFDGDSFSGGMTGAMGSADFYGTKRVGD